MTIRVSLGFSRVIGVLGLLFWVWAPNLSSAAGAEAVRVGIYDNPPKVFLTRNGIPAGLYPDLLNAIAKERGWSLTYVPGSWQQCIDRLKTGEIDILVDIAKTEERLSDFMFSREPVLTNWGAVYSRRTLSVASFRDMKDKTVAVVRGSAHTEGRDGFLHLMDLFEIPFRSVMVDDYPQAMMLVDSGQADACVVNRLFGVLYSEKYEVEATPLVFSPKVLLFAGRTGSEKSGQYLDQIDETLVRYKKDPDSVFHQAMGYYLSGGREKWENLQAGPLKELDLSVEEQDWITAHPVIRFGFDRNFVPFEFLSTQGEFTGMAADYLKLISEKTGIRFQQKDGDSWTRTLSMAEAKEIDLLPCLGSSEMRRRFLLFTRPYVQFSRVIITRIDSPAVQQAGVSALEGRRVGVQERSSHHDFLATVAGITPVYFSTFQEAVVALSEGKVDAVIGNLAVASHVIKNLSLTNLKFAGYASSEPQPLSMGIRKDWPELAGILDKALASVTYREKNRILSRWFPLPTEADSAIGLTQEEREWLLMNPRIRVAWDRHWAPIEFSDENGTPRGISMEYLSAIENMLGIEFDMGHDLGWKELESQVEKRELDMFSCVAITPRRLTHLAFTDTYLSLPVVIFAREDLPYVKDLSELSDKQWAVVEGYASDQWISDDYPDAAIHRVPTIEDGFTLLRDGQIDAFLCNVLPGNYYLSHSGVHGIKIAGETPYRLKLRMAVRKDWAVFCRILQKTLNALPEAEKTFFYRKWARVKYEKGFDHDLFKKIMGGVLLLILGIVLWNRYLAVEIARRKKTEARLALRETELHRKNRELEEMENLKDKLAHMIVHDMRSPLSAVGSALDMLEMKKAAPDFSAHLSRYLLLARNGIDTLSRMMQSLLDISRLESNALPLNLTEGDLQEVAKQVIGEMQSQAHVYGQTLIFSGQPCRGWFDTEMIRRVLINLVENAFKASPKGASVEIHTRPDDRSSGIRAAVRDSGCGIPPEFQDKVFDKFSKLETSGSQAVPSYGLGLAFCKLAVEAHGGQIQVRSREGHGSVFSFTLPGKPET